ncbi:MAG: pyridoxal phosphate-dependent aminotransferase [Candidatus Cloacimonetes bacterium]|nr:pyridoxal phosphate-dependent aminotransferase [Candidatus Cloacimonadota bacterium]
MQYNFDKIIKRTGTKSYKWDDNFEKFGHNDLIPMWVADMDFEAPPEVVKALRKRVSHGAYGYTKRPETYYKVFIDWIKKKHDWQIERDWIIDAPGIVPAISFAINTFTSPSDNILEFSPVYDPFFNTVVFNQRNLILSELKLVNGRYFIDFADFENKAARGIKMVILCSPHNPLARVWSPEELKKIGDICCKYNILIVSDEVHSDLIFSDKTHHPIASISEEIADRTITLNAPSKTFNLAGLLTAAVIISNNDLRSKYARTLESHGFTTGNLFGIEAFENAYKFGEEWLNELLIYLEDNYTYLKDVLKSETPLIKPTETDGTYLVWLDCRDLNLPQSELNEFFIYQAMLGLNSGTQYGKNGEGFMRMNIACPRKILEKAIDQLVLAYKNRGF